LIYVKISLPEGGRFYDFRTGYYAAGEAVLHRGSAALWPLVQDRWFVNLPIIAWVCAPLALLGPRGATLTFVFLGLFAVAGVYLLIANQCPARGRPLLLLVLSLNGPLWYSIVIGNSTHFILLLLVSALVLWKQKWTYAAGILVGAAAVVKPMILLFGLYFLWRRNWRIVLGGATIVGIAVFSTIAVFGLQFTLGWYQQIVQAFAGRPMGAHNVQSVDAFLLRLQIGSDLLFNWQPQTMPFLLGITRNVVVGSLFALMAWAMWLNRRAPESLLDAAPQGIDYLEFCLILNVCVTLSTVSWIHYYMLLLIPWSLYIAGRLPLRDDRLTHALMWGSFILCSVPCTYPRLSTGWLADLSARTIQSVWLSGGLLLLFALLRSAFFRPRRNVEPWLPDVFALHAEAKISSHPGASSSGPLGG
jgi:hypothetical protein